MDNEIKSMPMVPLRGMTILPEMVVHFDVSRQRSIAAVQEAMAEGQEIFLVTQRCASIRKIRMQRMCLRSVRWRRSGRSSVFRNRSCGSWLRENTGDACRRSNIKILTCVRKSR